MPTAVPLFRIRTFSRAAVVRLLRSGHAKCVMQVEASSTTSGEITYDPLLRCMSPRAEDALRAELVLSICTIPNGLARSRPVAKQQADRLRLAAQELSGADASAQ